MCGIAGIVVRAGDASVDRRVLETLRDRQRHRGPDDAGLWLDAQGRVGLAHRRLSIIDLSEAGHQPMATEDGRLRVVFNGEIYNFPALRRELEAKGCVFRSQSDTEVLLHGWRTWGHEMLSRLRGMFAFALHDARSGDLWLARDPLGIKPLYWTDDGRQLAFASEVQPLRDVTVDGSLDPEGLATYLTWGSIAAPRTLYRGIHALPSGSWLRVRDGGIEGPNAFYRLENELSGAVAGAGMTEEESLERVRDALVDSVRCHLLADVPVGAFLSGGVDSSALVGLLSELHEGPVRTVSLAFEDSPLDESALAREAAALYGTDHHEIPIRIAGIRDRMPDAVRALDQPSVDGINTYFVSEAAVQAGLKVCVSGVGGDEIFGGYGTFTSIPRWMALHRRLRRVPGSAWLLKPGRSLWDRPVGERRLAKLQRLLAYGGDVHGAYFVDRGLFAPGEIRALLHPDLAEAVRVCEPRRHLAGRVDAEALPPEERVSALELRQYLASQLLRDTDATSMRHSLEVRTPLVDHVLLAAVAGVPPALRRAGPAKKALRLAPRPPVPEALWNRRKQGFTLPFERWLRSGALEPDLPSGMAFRGEAVEAIHRAVLQGRLHWSRLWALHVLAPFVPR